MSHTQSKLDIPTTIRGVTDNGGGVASRSYPRSDQVGKVSWESDNAIILSKDSFFEGINREFTSIRADPTKEWMQYIPMTRIFGGFTRTLVLKDAHVAFSPQPAFKPPPTLIKKITTPATSRLLRTYRAPDSAGIVFRNVKDVAVSSKKDAAASSKKDVAASSKNDAAASSKNGICYETCWWCEDKPAALGKCMDELKEFTPSPKVEKAVRQLHMQAFYVVAESVPEDLDTVSDPVISSENGLYAFLTTGETFTLFYYSRPSDWLLFINDMLFEGVPEGAAKHLKPQVILLNERILDLSTKEFSKAMLCAFEMLRNVVGNVTSVQPSYYEPRNTITVDKIVDFNNTDRMKDILNRIANGEGEYSSSDSSDSPQSSPLGDKSYQGAHFQPSTPTRFTRSMSRNSSGVESNVDDELETDPEETQSQDSLESGGELDVHGSPLMEAGYARKRGHEVISSPEAAHKTQRNKKQLKASTDNGEDSQILPDRFADNLNLGSSSQSRRSRQN